MSPVAFNIYTTAQLGDKLDLLTQGFNEVFEKNIETNFFKTYYTSNPRGESYHSIMEHEGKVVGAITALPYEYAYHGEKKIFTYLGGLFIKEAYRKDALAMFKMYRNLKSFLAEKNVAVMMAVPNDKSYPYFKHALKWTEIANLPYYALPVKAGNVLKKSSLLNVPSALFSKLSAAVHGMGSSLKNTTTADFAVHILPNEPLMETHRYNNDHKKVKTQNHSFFYRMENEDGVLTAYLINFYNRENKKDLKSLTAAVKYILKAEKVDLILFIGTMGFTQSLLIKIPKSKEPRALHFCAEIINKEAIREDVYDYNKWDFGLYNFDVR